MLSRSQMENLKSDNKNMFLKMRGLPWRMGAVLFNVPGSLERRGSASHTNTHRVEPRVQESVCLPSGLGQEGGLGCKD